MPPAEAVGTDESDPVDASEQALRDQPGSLRTASSKLAPVHFARHFAIGRTDDLFFAFEARRLAPGQHQLALDVFAPGGVPWVHLEQTFSAGERAWVSMPVAGSLIESANLSGGWSATAFVDGQAQPSSTAGFVLK